MNMRCDCVHNREHQLRIYKCMEIQITSFQNVLDQLQLRSMSTSSGFPLSLSLSSNSVPSWPLSPAPNAYSLPKSVSANVWAF
eukprot:c17906_g1_i1 orf=1-246(-)